MRILRNKEVELRDLNGEVIEVWMILQALLYVDLQAMPADLRVEML